jgi:hypothetical protein
VAHLQIPIWNTINVPSLFIAVFAVVAVFRCKLGVIPTIGYSAALGVFYHLVWWRMM